MFVEVKTRRAGSAHSYPKIQSPRLGWSIFKAPLTRILTLESLSFPIG